MNSKPCIIFDIDGTLANNSHRQHLVQQKPADWKAYNELMFADTTHLEIGVLAEMFDFLRKTKNSVYEDFELILVSGREEIYRDVTERWLKASHLDFFDKLYMRKAGDYRDDCIVKDEIATEIEKTHHILCVFDDRNKVVDMWRKRGQVCLQVAPGDF